MGKSTINGPFNCYVSSPEGICHMAYLTRMLIARSLSRQNLLAEERERKRFWANEQLHAEAVCGLRPCVHMDVNEWAWNSNIIYIYILYIE